MIAKTRNGESVIYLVDKKYTELNPLICGSHKCPSGHSAVGMRSYYMIHYVKSGTGTVYADGREYRLEKGKTFLILPYEDVKYIADSVDPWSYSYICFNGALAKKLDTSMRIREASSTPFSMLDELGEREDTHEEIATAALYMIFAELTSGSEPKPLYVERAVNMINVSFYQDKLTVESIAASIGLDRRYLSRIFKASMGMTIQDYIINVRMSNAKKILKSGTSVGSTAPLVGYTDSFTFSKMFKKHVGISPKQYALTHKK